MNNPKTILVVEDDRQIRHFIVYILEAEGFQCLSADDAQTAMMFLVSENVDLLLLDLGLPDFDGMDVIDKLREWSNIPIIVVSARDQDREKAEALDRGADDYLTKPFSKTELLARIRVALRHVELFEATTRDPVLSVGDLSIDLDKQQVFLKGAPIHLTQKEYSLLSFLFKNMGKVLTTQAILREIYGVGYGTDTRALRTLMAGLRRKIETTPAKPRYIKTEIGVGYRLADQ
ncbi:MAG: response regulator transcription factor [Peptoniphilus sp.]|nr:response regulator transcription factor [Peptoniphilus sp.]MDD7363451.1 response regulator transcription factor [Bacillota bacterium]MDY6044845.1 response regulator transcription factor [Peptoniphilus sp.]